MEYVKGHAGIEGNEGADQLANKGCTFPEVSKEPDWTNLEAKVRKVTALTESKAKQTVAHVAGPSREPDKVPLPISTSEISRASFSTQMLKSDPYSPGSSSFEPLSSPGRASRGFKPTTAVAYVPNATPSVATPSRPAYMPTRTMNLPSYESGPTVPEVTRPTFTPTRVMRSPMIMPEVECSIPYRRARKGVDPNTTYRDVGVVTIAIPDGAPPVISAPKPVATQSVELTLEDLDVSPTFRLTEMKHD